ncbi:LURP-one-related/scramblase family protein [uncultured Clostridium sp.]|uniref:LURP-one-related/scramblase family protein n=1 Tax=uncultured Clostridium sp. TaxID=59620 RepID=UPI0026F23552|nr:LURP-one-related family protein [uncultured Clostridium sp.]
MKYYIKSKLFKIKEDFWVKNDTGKDCYFIDKEFFSFGLQFSVIKNNNEIYKVREKMFKFMPSYEIYDINNSLVGRVKKQFTFFKDNIFVESNYGNFEIQGDFWHHSYIINHNGRNISVIDKEFLSFTDNYYVDINYENHPFIIALVIIIDDIIDKCNNTK